MLFVRRIAILLLVTSVGFASEAVLDPDLPMPLDDGTNEAMQTLLTHSPFVRIVRMEDTLQLTGLAYVDGRPFATFFNRETKMPHVVSEEPNAQGWKLTEATLGDELRATEVHLVIDGEEIMMQYGETQLSAGASRKGLYAGRSGADGSGRFRTSSLLGKDGLKLYAALSPDMRDKFKEIVNSHRDKNPQESMEDQSAFAQRIYEKLKSADQRSGGSPSAKKSASSASPSKKGVGTPGGVKKSGSGTSSSKKAKMLKKGKG